MEDKGLNYVYIDAFDLDDAWFQALSAILDKGYVYKITRGSYEGQHRLEFDGVTIRVRNPKHQIIPIIPEGMSIPPPTDMNYVSGDYLMYLMTDQKTKTEDYTYGERLNNFKIRIQKDVVEGDGFAHKALDKEEIVEGTNQIQETIKMFKRSGAGTNQATMEIGMPSDIKLTEPPCVLPETLITTNKGFIRADKIQVGDNILTHKGRFKKVKEVFKREYNGKMYSIIGSNFNYNVNLTNNHPLLTIKGQYCPWDHSIKSKLNCRPNCKKRKSCYNDKCPKSYKNYIIDWTNAENLTKNNYLAIPKLKLGNIKCPFSEKEMWIFGLFLADGDYLKEYSGIRFSLGTHEKELISKVIVIMKELYNINPTFTIDKKEPTCTRVNFYSVKLAKLCFKLFGKYAREKRIPQYFIKYNNKLLISLIKGYIEGDGYERNNSLEWTTTSINLSNFFKLCLQKVGWVPCCHNINIKDSKINGRIIKSNGLGYGFQYNTKKTKIKSWEDKNYYYVPIKNISNYNYRGLVYNFEVEEDNSYIAGGITVHNCCRLIDCRMRYGKLHFFIYFRSWDLWGGFPSNLGGIQLLKQYMAEQIGCEDGEMVLMSKGLHLYEYVWEYAKLRTGKMDLKIKLPE